MADAERRLAVVTGGGSGIGRASALRMARAGRDVVVLDRVSQEEIDHPGNAIGRLANPEEIAAVVNFLTSEENTYMSGSIVPVTGGPPW